MLLEQEVKETYTSKINKGFYWLNSTFTPLLKESFENFWENKFQLKLLATLKNDFSLFKTEELFVTKIGVKKNIDVIIRTPKSVIEMFLNTFGRTQIPFDITQITEIEAKIINSFNEYLYENFKKALSIPDGQYNQKADNVTLVYAIQNKNNEIGRYIISIPENILCQENILHKTFNINVEDLTNTSATVDIRVGSTIMSLNELKNLSVEDIVILDNSNLNKMQIRIENQESYFRVSPDPILIMNIENDGENDMENATLSQDMWDNIPVELGAEFEKIKISLGDLKQISEGLVVDIGSIYENKIFLKVENKNIAEGELVIVNDRYGVRIDKIFGEEEMQVQQAQNYAQEETSYQEEVAVNEEELSEDDFDYSDFEIEDENI